ncbi:M20 family metallo-hydrolase [Algoriphagus halophytocola]|uniref:M20 family metallo-hydrolase n=1 Tax=Algoriphagus halophytocola TaxID=2991499 RepID=A0ABY6MHC1_9BACT|nr:MULTISPECIES: M20 family metallo-hydrolase [unclassified Algoriphagus]UZD23187.1 M20 family metallo-hydrolase [Algoriphagus sp. TR-M5]WBL44479.1 M20 family metallo-hydrolase [Algoriphagus sp. TR-M9]
MKDTQELFEDAVELLKQLIETPSLSRAENATADILEEYFSSRAIPFTKSGNNIWAFASSFDRNKPTLWLNSHHDTVKPNAGYTKDPFLPTIEDGKLYGLGSNDAGGPLVSLIAAFTYFYGQDLPFNLIMIASAEEEISGKNGIAAVIDQLPACDLAIVGEPTLMDMAVAEKGLMVIDAKVYGKAGHAAREEGINAIYLALEDLQKIKDFQFKKVSQFLGKTKVSATVIHAGQQHNVVPDICEFVLDVRVTDAYTLQEALDELKSELNAELTPRSLRLQSSHVPEGHLILKVGEKLGKNTYGSPTLSDQALIPYPSVKIGPGDSARSHSADEFIYLKEIENGILGYIQILETYAAMLLKN